MTAAGYVHTAFGSTVRCNVALPGLRQGSGGDRRIDVHMGSAVDQTRRGTGPAVLATIMERVWRSSDGWLARYEHPDGHDSWTMDVAADGGAIRVEHTAGMALPDILQMVQTVGLASALQRQGVLLLHGCVAEVGGRAALLLGASGAGKSATAAAFMRRGRALLSDDIAAVEVAGDVIVAQPGPPRLRVTPHTARATGWNPDLLPRVFSTPLLADKRHVELSAADGSFCAEARTIAAIFVLAARTNAAQATLARLAPRDALAALRANGYRDAVLDRGQQAWRFPLLARLAHEVPLHVVCAADDIDALPGLVDSLVDETLRTLPTPTPTRPPGGDLPR